MKKSNPVSNLNQEEIEMLWQEKGAKDWYEDYSGICAGEGQAKRLKPLPSKNFGVLATLNTAIFGI